MKHLAFTGSLIVCFCFLIGCQKPTEDMDISYTISGKVLNEATSEYYGSDKYISIFGTRKLGLLAGDSVQIIERIRLNDKGAYSFEYDKFLTDDEAEDLETNYIFITNDYAFDEKLIRLRYNENHENVELNILEE